MLKLGTVFSGIGAIEHALQRMGIETEIEFACDTGDVDIFSRKMKVTIEDTELSFVELDELMNTKVIKTQKDESFFIQLQEEIDILKEKFVELQKKSFEKKDLKNITDFISMKFEKFKTYKAQQDLKEFNSYDEKKKYVDNLYAKKAKNNKVKQSYFANYPITEDKWHYNICLMDGSQWRNKIDLFVGGSPCQSFSVAGKRRGLEDTRGTLFYEYARLIKEIQPKVFIYENVKGLLNHDKGNTWEIMKSVFNELGYTYFYKLLNATDYGIPQNRKRIFVIGFRNDLILKKTFEFPKPIPLNLTMQDFLLDNVSGRYYLSPTQVKFVNDEVRLKKNYTQIDGKIALCQTKHQQFNLTGDFVFVEENKDMEKTIQELEKYFLSEKVIKCVMDDRFYLKPVTDKQIASTLLKSMHKMHRAGVDNYVHTEGRLRRLTPRECFRLMGFCDSFKIVVADTPAYMQAGNSIVVDVLIHIMKQILESYDFI